MNSSDASQSTDVSSAPSRALMSQRTYNTISYAGAACVMGIVFDWRSGLAALMAGLYVAHFLRRTAESLWVHRFSGRMVPPSDYLVEHLYYWGCRAPTTPPLPSFR